MPTRKTYCLPSLVTTFIALALLVLVTISVPLTTHSSSPFYIVQASNLDGTIRDGTTGNGNEVNADRRLTAIRAGLWGYCSQGEGENRFGYCSPNGHEYNITLVAVENAAYGSVTINRSWTRGLVVVVVALVSTAIGFILSFFPQLMVQILAALVLFLSLLLTLIGFAIQIAYFIYFRRRIGNVTDTSSVSPGAGFYMTLVTLPLLVFSMLTVFCGWRSDKAGNVSTSSSAYGGAAYGGEEVGPKRRFGVAMPWKKNKNSAATSQGYPYGTTNGSVGGGGYGAGGYGQREYDDGTVTGTGTTKDDIPLSSRQRVLDAFHKS